MNKCTPMSVEDRLLEGYCEGCDQDPAACLNRDYCIYEDEESDDGKNV